MLRAREAILAHGGAGTSNVFTRMLLALHGIIPWHAVPTIPVEIMYLPRWFPFHLFRISYWGRTVLAPLLVLQAMKPSSRHPHGVTIDELFPGRSRAHPARAARVASIASVVRGLRAHRCDLIRFTEPFFPPGLASARSPRPLRSSPSALNGEGGLGAIFPAMANTRDAVRRAGLSARSPRRVIAARTAIDKLIVLKRDEAYCQPCVSPVWDTVLACHALIEVGSEQALAGARKGLVWLGPRQVLDTVGDWADQRPARASGRLGISVRESALSRPGRHGGGGDGDGPRRASPRSLGRRRLQRGRSAAAASGFWDCRAANGGWGAFDADNTSEYLNHIPFADHGALLDPPTADVTARCASMIAQLGMLNRIARRCDARPRRSCAERRRPTAPGMGAGG